MIYAKRGALQIRHGWVVLFAVLVAVALAFAVPEPANAAGSSVIEAESMSKAGKVFADKAASRDRGRAFFNGGTALKNFHGSIARVAVRARGDLCKGAPRMVVKVDGRQVMSRLVKSKKWKSYETTFSAADRAHRATITFTNNSRKAKSCDRNLYADKLDLTRVAPTQDAPTQDAVVDRNLSELQGFVDWLDRENARGYIGEVGWSNSIQRGFGDAGRWNVVAEEWYKKADVANLWVTAWGVDERQRWGGFWLSTYTSVGDGSVKPISVPQSQASILEAHPTTPGYQRGINVSGAEGTEVGFSNRNPGVYGEDYWYGSQETFDYLRSRGITTVRLPFRWERIQPTLGGKLDPTELARLKECVRRAGNADLKVVLDVHNYGGYRLYDPQTNSGVERKLGSSYIGQADLADLWAKLSVEFKDDADVLAYDLMNEPNGMPSGSNKTAAQVWEDASQASLDAVRANGDGKLVMVPGYQYSGVWAWSTNHPHKWINDSANNHMYTAHQYFDGNRSGYYRDPYTTELVNQR